MAEPTRNLALELVRVTEAAALAAGRFVGRGDKNAADKAAVDAMRLVMNSIQMDGVIVIGEGEKDEAPMLFNGERLGTGVAPAVDIAVDPIDGTRPLANGLDNTIAVVALAPRGTMFNPGPFVYMNKLVVGPAAAGVIDIQAPVRDNLEKIAHAKGEKVPPPRCAAWVAASRAGFMRARRRRKPAADRQVWILKKCSPWMTLSVRRMSSSLPPASPEGNF
jgi:fructose-1,6-bisphosphatase II